MRPDESRPARDDEHAYHAGDCNTRATGGRPAPCRRSARERGRAEPAARLPGLLARRRKDVEDDAARRERPPAVGHVGRRLPETAGADVVLDAVLDADSLTL